MLLYGEVGRGKSMLLDLLYDSLPSRKKRRWHFNTFMLDIFRRLERGRIARMADPRWKLGMEHEHCVLALARDTVASSPILFLDEFQLPDRTSSKLVNGFMTGFFHLGGVLVASSNRMPEELAKAAGVEFVGGQRDLMGSLFGWATGRSEGQRAAQSDFGQFLEVLKARCEVWEMEGERDWRREDDVTPEKGQDNGVDFQEETEGKNIATSSTLLETTQIPSSDTPLHYHISFPPTSADHDSATSKWLEEVTSLNPIQSWQSSSVHVYGRTISIPQTSTSPPGIAQFSFHALCASNLGAADYITLASTFHTIILTDVPILTLLQKNEARRFITLLDALYESKCRLLVQAAAPPDSLFFPETLRRNSVNSSSGSGSAVPTLPNTPGNPENDSDSDSVYQETFSEIYQDRLQPFRPNISTYNASNDSAATPFAAFEPRSVLADEDADFGPTYGNGRGHGHSQSGGQEGLEATLKRQEAAAGNGGPDFSKLDQLTGEDERFAYKRARSRLWEMCGRRWWDERSEGLGRRVEEWWRPVERGAEGRFWEKSGEREEGMEADNTRLVVAAIVEREIGGNVGGAARGSHDGSPRLAADEGVFKHGASPFRTSSEPPPKLTERHVWGLGLWGPKAGRWGRGEVREKSKNENEKERGEGAGEMEQRTAESTMRDRRRRRGDSSMKGEGSGEV